MKDFAERIAKLSPQKLALLAIDLQRRIEARTEPVAIVGIGCRFPGGVRDGESFWRLLKEGRSAVGPIPESRWPAGAWRKADMPTPDCGFVEGIDEFDPLFFGMSPHEAASLDPQQRLLLEVAWEALEDAAIAPDRLSGSRTGVFVGLSTHDYSQLSMSDSPATMDAYTMTGSSHAVAAGRLSYVLGLQGPSMSIDTSCSSSLMAVHLACQSLRAGECDMALAGGVNAILSPAMSAILAKSGLLAPDGRCKFGDGAADGYVRGEGCGMVVLKTLSAARAAGDPVFALIRSSAVNQDGRSSGLTVPNGPAQMALIRQAIAQAGVEPNEIGYIEAHGTGTSLGDPIELQAIGSVLGKGRSTPLRVGSIKTNLGHLEAAAGIAGLIKLALCLRNGKIAPSLNVTQPTPHVNWPALGVEIARNVEAWPGERRVGGISSFGFSGTNVHAVLEAAESVGEAESQSGGASVFVLSARDEKALRELAGKWADRVESASAISLGAICRTSVLGRAHFAQRLACVASDRNELVRKLRAIAMGTQVEGLFVGEARGPVPPEVALRFAPDCTAQIREQAANQWREWGVRGASCTEQRIVIEIREGGCARDRMLQFAAELFVQGVALNWTAIAGADGRAVSMPTYPFQRQRYWLDSVRPMTPEEWGRRGATPAQPDVVGDCLYGIAWREQAAPIQAGIVAAEPLSEIANGLQGCVAELCAENHLGDYDTLQPEIDRLCAQYIVHGFRRLGWSPRPGDRFTLDGFVDELKIVGAQRRLTERLLNTLVQDGLLERSSDAYVWRAAIEPADPDGRLVELIEKFPACSAELSLFSRCAPALAEVLRGECNALDLIFPGGDMSVAERLYQESPATRAFNMLLARAVESVIAGLPADKPIRIVEIGAGTGGTTAHLVDRLPAARARYTYTDISPVFTEWGARKFKDRAFVETALLDISRDPAAQGFAPRAYDVVIAANVLHATPDLREALANAQRLLAPGGVLVLLEVVQAQRFGDLTLGMTEGWWAFSDRDLRPDSALLSAERWSKLLGDCGYEETTLLPGDAQISGAALQQQRVIVARAPRSDRSGHWLIVPDHTGVAKALAARLGSRGESCQLWSADSALRMPPSTVGIVDCRALDAETTEDASAPELMQRVSDLLGGAVELVSSIAAESNEPRPRFWVVTRGASAVDGVAAPEQAALGGLARVIALERPEFNCTQVDLDPAASPEENAEALARELEPGSPEPQSAWRGGVRTVARLERADLRAGEKPAIRPDGAYLITGGLGGLGLVTAKWLASRGARNIFLMGRRAPGAEAQAKIEELKRMGARVETVECDVSRHEQLRAALGHIGPVHGIFHTAGVLDDSVLERQDRARVERVLAPKVAGAWNLHCLTQGLDLDHFVLYSSGSSLIGAAGQANYAAANAFLDGLAHWRRARGLAATSVNWGPWTQIGFASGRTFGQAVSTISIERGFAVLDRLVAARPAQVGVIPVDWREFMALWPHGAPPLYEDFANAGKEAAHAAEPAGLAREVLMDADPGERVHMLTEFLRQELGEVLGFGGPIDPRRSILELGFDSLMAVKLRGRIQSKLGLHIALKRLLDGPSAETIAARLLENADERPALAAGVADGTQTVWEEGVL